MRNVDIIIIGFYLAAIILPAILGLWMISVAALFIGIAGLTHLNYHRRKISSIIENQIRLIERISLQLNTIGNEIERLRISSHEQGNIYNPEKPGPEIMDVVQKVIELENRLSKLKSKQSL